MEQDTAVTIIRLFYNALERTMTKKILDSDDHCHHICQFILLRSPAFCQYFTESPVRKIFFSHLNTSGYRVVPMLSCGTNMCWWRVFFLCRDISVSVFFFFAEIYLWLYISIHFTLMLKRNLTVNTCQYQRQSVMHFEILKKSSMYSFCVNVSNKIVILSDSS